MPAHKAMPGFGTRFRDSRIQGRGLSVILFTGHAMVDEESENLLKGRLL